MFPVVGRQPVREARFARKLMENVNTEILKKFIGYILSVCANNIRGGTFSGMVFPFIPQRLKRGVCSGAVLKGRIEMFDKIALALLVIGGLNWGLVGIFSFDLVAWLFGGTGAILSRVVYVLVALSAIWCITFLFRRDSIAESRS